MYLMSDRKSYTINFIDNQLECKKLRGTVESAENSICTFSLFLYVHTKVIYYTSFLEDAKSTYFKSNHITPYHSNKTERFPNIVAWNFDSLYVFYFASSGRSKSKMFLCYKRCQAVSINRK